MERSQRRLLWIWLCFSSFLFGQQQSIQPPVSIPIGLSGTFGEIRAANIHAGIDIRTQGREGLSVNSAWQGYVSRISVSTGGYGKAVYVTHPNGLMSVYAHLKRFAPRIEAYIKKWQYENASYTLQRFLKQGEIEIKQGELLGYSGNTGRSFGPHLHFELRDATTQEPVNPMQYGIEVEDQQRPQIVRLLVYQKQANDSINVLRNQRLTKVNDSLYTLPLFKAGGILGFGLQLFDRQDRSWSKNGVYQIRLVVNGVERYYYRSDRMSYKDSRHVSQLFDYTTYVNQKIKVQKLFNPLHQKFSFLNDTQNSFVSVKEGNAYQVLIEVEDYKGNRSLVETYITGITEKNKTVTEPLEQKLILPDRDYRYEFNGKSIYFPKESFYRPHYINISANEDTLFIDRNRLPMKKSLEIEIPIYTEDSIQRRQTFIARLDKKGKPVYQSTKIDGGYWKTKTMGLGQFILSRDTLAPEIQPQNFKAKQWLSKYRYLKFKIKDDLSGIKSYHTTINGKWARFEYEPKTQTLTYDFNDQTFEAAEHKIRLEVKDNSGNLSTFETIVYRKYNAN